jgi:hypothetical protein
VHDQKRPLLYSSISHHLSLTLTHTHTPNMNSSILLIREPGGLVSIVSGYGLDDRAIEVRSPAGASDFSSNLCPDRLWGPLSLLYNGYRGVLSPGVKRGRGVTLTTHPRLVPRT